MSIFEDDTLRPHALLYNGLVGAELLEPDTDPEFSGLPSATSTSGSHTILWANMAVTGFSTRTAANYNITKKENGMLTVAPRPYTLTVVDGGSGSGSSSSSSSGSTPPAVVTPDGKRPDAPTLAETTAAATPDGKGGATVTIPGALVDSAVKNAQSAAKENGAGGDVAVRVNINGGDAATVAVHLPNAAQKTLIAAQVRQFTLALARPDIVLSLNLDAIKAIHEQANADVQFSLTRLTGARPTFALSADYQGGSVKDLGAGSVLIEIPYTRAAGEEIGSLCAVCVDDAGAPSYLTKSVYDAERGVMRLPAKQFTTYRIDYKPVSLDDTQGNWAQDDIAFAVTRGLLLGTGGDRFSPDVSMNRGMFVTVLGRLAGVDAGSYTGGRFTDVSADSYCAPYVNWAAEKGIVHGIGDGLFSPEQSVTREQMAVLLMNYASVTGLAMPELAPETAFPDSALVADWAADTVKAAQRTGVLLGKDGDRLDPTATATRGEAAAMLRRFVERLIDSGAARD